VTCPSVDPFSKNGICGRPIRIGCVVAKAPDNDESLGVACCLLNITQRNTIIKCCGNERMTQAVGRNALFSYPGAFRESFHGSVCGISVHALSVRSEEDRTAGSFVDVPIDRSFVRGASGIATCLPSLRTIARVRWLRSMSVDVMSALSASLIRKPFNASNEINA
jgi:hypothetical protein